MSYSSVVLADTPLVYWKLNDVGPTAADSVGGTFPGAADVGVAFGQPGVIAGDTCVDIESGGAITAVNIPATNFGAGSYSIEAWLNYWNPAVMMVVTKGTNATPGWRATLLTGPVRLALFWGDDGSVYPADTAPVTKDAWHHVVWGYDAGTSEVFYALDGSVRRFASANHPVSNIVNVKLGRDADGSYRYNGLLAHVAIYGYALSAAQIAAHVAASGVTFGGGVAGVPAWLLSEDFMANSYNVCAPITPSDTVDFPRVTDAVLVGATGDVNGVLQNGQAVLLKGLPAGAWVPVRFKRINAAATTASGLVALFVT